jgi:competence protein ComEC
MSIDRHKLPFVRLLIPFVCGILAAIYIPYVSNAVTIGITLSVLLGVVVVKFYPFSFKNRWVFGFLSNALLLSWGYILTFNHDELNDTHHFKNHIQQEKKQFVLGTVEDISEKNRYIRLKMLVKKIGRTADSLSDCTGYLLTYIKKDSIHPPPQLGSHLIVFSNIQEIEPPKNPMAVDFQRYWHFQNIHYQCFTDYENIQRIDVPISFSLSVFFKKQQIKLTEILRRHIPTENEFAVGTALLLGYKDAVTDEIKNAYVETGAMHILAVSGMHLVLLFQIFEKLLSFYKSGSRRWRWTKTILIILLIWSFALLTGMGASVVRAAVMSSFLAIGKVLRRLASVYNILAASAFVLLLYNPFWLMDVGFQLSYAAVLGIVSVFTYLKKIFIIKNKLLRTLWELLAISLAAQLVATPISLYYFHQFPTYFWLTGIAAVVVSEAALIVGILLLTVHWVVMVGNIVGKILFGFLWLMNKIIFTVQSLPFNLIDGFWIPLPTVILFYLILFGFCYAIFTRKLKTFYYPLSICLCLSTFYAFLSVKNRTLRQLIVYHTPRNSLVEIIDDKKCYFFLKKFSVQNENNSRIKFASEHYHKYLKIRALYPHSYDTCYKSNIFYYCNKFIQIGGLRGAFLDNLPQTPLSLELDFVVIQDNPSFLIEDLKQKLSFKELIFDTSNSFWRIKKWKSECDKIGVIYYDVNEKGAWIKNF